MANGSSFQLGNAAFTNGLKATLTVPDRTGMLAEYVFGNNATQTTTNRANNSANGTLIGAGTPVYNPNSVMLSTYASYGNGVAEIDTGLTFTNDMTFVVIRKKMTQGSAASAPWFGGTDSAFRGLLDYSGWNAYNNQSGAPPQIGTETAPTDTSFYFVAGALPNGGPATMYLATAGTVNSNTGTVNGSVHSTNSNTIKIANPGSNYQIELAYAAIFNRVLTAQQVTDLYNSVKAFYASQGVTIS